jgi:MFS family permease
MRTVASNTTVSPDSLVAVTCTVRGVEPSFSAATPLIRVPVPQRALPAGRAGFTPLHAGLLTLPMAVMTGLLPPVSARLVSSRGPRVPLVIAGIAMASSALLLALVLRADTPISVMVVVYILFGVGFGMVNAPITNTAVSGMPRSESGAAGGVASTGRQTGAALGVAVLGSLVTSSIGGPFAADFASAARPAWVVMVGCGVAIFLLGLVATGRRALRCAVRAAELFDEPELTAPRTPERAELPASRGQPREEWVARPRARAV